MQPHVRITRCHGAQLLEDALRRCAARITCAFCDAVMGAAAARAAVDGGDASGDVDDLLWLEALGQPRHLPSRAIRVSRSVRRSLGHQEAHVQRGCSVWVQPRHRRGHRKGLLLDGAEVDGRRLADKGWLRGAAAARLQRGDAFALEELEALAERADLMSKGMEGQGRSRKVRMRRRRS